MTPDHFNKNPLSTANTIWRSCGRLSVPRPQRESGFVPHPCLAVLFLRQKILFFQNLYRVQWASKFHETSIFEISIHEYLKL